MISLNGNTLNINVFFNEYDEYETYEYSLMIAKSFSINKTPDLEWRLLSEEAPTSITPQTIGANLSFEAVPYTFIPYSMYNFVHAKVVIAGLEGVHEIYAGCVSDNRYNQVLYNNNECEVYYKGRKCLLSPFENKKKLNLLMIGSSFCYYYVKELVAMAATIGVDLTIGNIYKSGASMEEYKNYVEGTINNQLNLFITDKTGRTKVKSLTSWAECVSYSSTWDIVTLQHHFGASDKLQESYEVVATNIDVVLEAIKNQFPNAILGMQEEWAYGLGNSKIGGSKDIQEKTYRVIQNVTKRITEEYNLFYVPTGDAWQYARKNTLVGDNLNRRILGATFEVLTDETTKTGVGDYYHDGDIGGGRYLNACVWFEILFGQSCIGNTYRPEYPIDEAPDLDPVYNKINSSDANDNEEYIKILQEAAHKAVLLM